jgi:hypothetical protein
MVRIMSKVELLAKQLKPAIPLNANLSDVSTIANVSASFLVGNFPESRWPCT